MSCAVGGWVTAIPGWNMHACSLACKLTQMKRALFIDLASLV